MNENHQFPKKDSKNKCLDEIRCGLSVSPYDDDLFFARINTYDPSKLLKCEFTQMYKTPDV